MILTLTFNYFEVDSVWVKFYMIQIFRFACYTSSSNNSEEQRFGYYSYDLAKNTHSQSKNKLNPFPYSSRNYDYDKK